MKEYDFKRIHCDNLYFSKGLIELINGLFQREFPEAGHSDTGMTEFPDIWVFSRDSAEELYPFIRQAVSHRLTIVFGKDCHKRVLSSVPGLEQMVFMDLNIPPERAGDRIKKAFIASRYGLPVNRVSFASDPILTFFEKWVLTGLMSGVSVSEFASRTGRSVNSISACKRRIMKKLNVFTNQELFAKAWAMGIHFDA
ncbi:helix-turn-helix transcriptional regulator [Klebsiella aerogenes]|uniref:helix-turn-helix transcriptional regulator n=1 Tax=Klebsiella aerogenes TaxID=548 RepID=UPI0007B3775F|nr:LuxR C-terminal-related transcriptional regulator [Klebsiella aerogenes]KZR13481.1 hypothetical protein A3N54_04480 [Klebsiella aerogenes]RNT25559.1 hypothetical protein B9031_015235 [Klebsiella aerogenes]